MFRHLPEYQVRSRYAHFFWQSVRGSVYLRVCDPWRVNVVEHYCFPVMKGDAALSRDELESLDIAMRAARIHFVGSWEPDFSRSAGDHDLRSVLSRSNRHTGRIDAMDMRQVAKALVEEVESGRLVFLPDRDELRACVRAIEADRARRRRPDPPRARSDEPLPAQVLYGNAPPARPVPVLQFMREQVGERANALVGKSPSLQGDLKVLHEADWKIRYGPPGGGSYVSRRNRVITLDGGIKNQHTEFVQTLSHEVGHAMYPYREDLSSKAAYIKGVMADEGAATMSNIRTQREIIANGGWDIGVAGKNHATYNVAYDVFLEDGNAAACRDAIGAAFGNEITSTATQTTYTDYYGGWYDMAYPSR